MRRAAKCPCHNRCFDGSVVFHGEVEMWLCPDCCITRQQQFLASHRPTINKTAATDRPAVDAAVTVINIAPASGVQVDSSGPVCTGLHAACLQTVTYGTMPWTSSSSGPWRQQVFQQCSNRTHCRGMTANVRTASRWCLGPMVDVWSGILRAQTRLPPAIWTEQSSAQEQSQTSPSVASPRNTDRCRHSTASRPLPSKHSERSAPRHRASSASSDSESRPSPESRGPSSSWCSSSVWLCSSEMLLAFWELFPIHRDWTISTICDLFYFFLQTLYKFAPFCYDMNSNLKK